jgi:hypothetical protein
MRLVRAVALVALACSARAPRDPPSNRGTDTASAGDGLEIEYRTWGLMPPPACGSPTYAIAIARDRAVMCGWYAACPPYSAAAPLRPTLRGRLTAAQADRIGELAGGAAFLALPSFSSNVHIIDGGEEQIRVRVAGRDKTVEMANTSAPAFAAVRDALETATGCTRASAGPPPR